MNRDRVIWGLLVALIGGCTWVKMTPEGEKVRVLEPHEVTSCKQLGKTTVTGKARVAGIERNQKKVTEELRTLALNSAARIDGDTVVPLTEIEGDSQVFAVYKCVNP